MSRIYLERCASVVAYFAKESGSEKVMATYIVVSNREPTGFILGMPYPDAVSMFSIMTSLASVTGQPDMEIDAVRVAYRIGHVLIMTKDVHAYIGYEGSDIENV